MLITPPTRILEKFDTILDTGTTSVDAHQPLTQPLKLYIIPAYKGELEHRQMRIGEHLDYGTITLLWQINDVP